MTPIRRFGWTALALFALVGCDAETTPPVNPPVTGGPVAEPKGPTETHADPIESAKSDDSKKVGDKDDQLTNDELAEIKKLPAEEQAAAIAQAVCPVSGHHLGEGGMGAPIKQTIGDKTFYICCGSCKDDVKKNPEAVLAKLKK